MEGKSQYSEADRRIVWEQFVSAHSKSQEDFDASVRTLAAGGVGITVSLATALRAVGPKGGAAVALFLASLGLNLISYVTAQLDMKVRIECLRIGRHSEIDGNSWSRATSLLNIVAGLTLIAGGAMLAWFVASRGGAA